MGGFVDVKQRRTRLPLIGTELIIAYWHACRDAPAKSTCLDWIQKRVQKKQITDTGFAAAIDNRQCRAKDVVL